MKTQDEEEEERHESRKTKAKSRKPWVQEVRRCGLLSAFLLHTSCSEATWVLGGKYIILRQLKSRMA